MVEVYPGMKGRRGALMTRRRRPSKSFRAHALASSLALPLYHGTGRLGSYLHTEHMIMTAHCDSARAPHHSITRGVRKREVQPPNENTNGNPKSMYLNRLL